MERLLQGGAFVTSGNNNGETHVHIAIAHGNLEAHLIIITKHVGCINFLISWSFISCVCLLLD